MSLLFHPNARADVESVLRCEDYPLDRVRLQDVRIVVDVGAHVGAFSVLASRYFPTSVVFAFEPLATNLSLLAANVAGTGRTVVSGSALSDFDGEMVIHHSLAFGYAASSSVRTRDHGDDAEVVQVRRASSALGELPRVDVLKIDTEGHELRILQDLGAEAVDQIPLIMLEVHSERDRRRMDEMLWHHELFYARTDMTNRHKLAYALAGSPRIVVNEAPALIP